MNILITGISSFIGSNLGKIFAENGHAITGTYSSYSERIERLNRLYPQIKTIQVDLSKPSSTYLLPADMHAIVHNSALLSSSDPRGADMVKRNILSTFNLADYSRVNELEKLIYISSLSVYGSISSSVVSEQTPICSPTPYGYTKYIGEKIVSTNKTPSVSIRLPGILGPEATRAWIPETCKKLINNEDVQIFNPANLFNNLIEVRSLGRFVLDLLTEKEWKEHHAFPVGAGDKMSIAEIVVTLKEQLNSRSELIEVNAKSNSFTIDSSYAIEQFGYKPDSCLESLMRYVNFLKSA